MKLTEVIKTENKISVKLIGKLIYKGKPIELFFEYPAEYAVFINPGADAFIPILLIPAMLERIDIEVIPEVSAKLTQNLEKIQDFFINWYPDDCNKIKVDIANTTAISIKNNSGGQFFSLGVDSFFTLIKNKTKIDYLVYMQGLELPLKRYKHNQERNVIEGINEVISNYGKKLIHGRTNLRDHFEIDWPKYYHGAGLAATALSLSGGLDSVYIASSHSYGANIPIGSSFMIDHLWSTESLKVIHDGAEKGRSFKVSELLVDDQFALDRIRVCTENDGGDFNCCKCRKCVMTMINLDIVGKLEDCKAFPSKNYPKNLKVLLPTTLSSYALLKDLHYFSIIHKKYEIAKRIEKELMIARHDLYGRKELSVSLPKYIMSFATYLIYKIFKF